MRKLLIAVYSRSITQSLKQALEQEYEVHTCSHGDSALALLGSLRPDVLLLDLLLPGRDGLSVLEQAAYKPPVIVALTAYTSRQLQLAAEAAGVTELLLYPCTVSYILAHLPPHTSPE